MIEHTNTWAQGDVAQGKLMLIAGAIVLLATILAWKNGGEMLKGMLVPLGLLVFIAAGYGGFMQVNRPAHATALAERYQQDPEGSRTAEIARVENDCKNYRMMNFIWSTFCIAGSRWSFSLVPARGKALGWD
ncbi:MAG: hypothetical protein IPL86_02460 [Flavobacteriales bacterium]|nr:hypothetical protein [Flavobacteriales bacterium]